VRERCAADNRCQTGVMRVSRAASPGRWLIPYAPAPFIEADSDDPDPCSFLEEHQPAKRLRSGPITRPEQPDKSEKDLL